MSEQHDMRSAPSDKDRRAAAEGGEATDWKMKAARALSSLCAALNEGSVTASDVYLEAFTRSTIGPGDGEIRALRLQVIHRKEIYIHSSDS